MAFHRMDNAYPGSIDISIKKARTSVLFNGMTTASLHDAATPPDGPLYGMFHFTQQSMLCELILTTQASKRPTAASLSSAVVCLSIRATTSSVALVSVVVPSTRTCRSSRLPSTGSPTRHPLEQFDWITLAQARYAFLNIHQCPRHTTSPELCPS